MDSTQTYELMVVEVRELGREGLNVVVYDLRDDDEATFTAGVDAHTPAPDDPDWRQAGPDELNASSVVQYVDHEWRSASIEYSEAGYIKHGSALDRVTETVLVDDPDALLARLSTEDDGVHVTVAEDTLHGQRLLYTETFTWDRLGLEVHPALRDE